MSLLNLFKTKKVLSNGYIPFNPKEDVWYRYSSCWEKGSDKKEIEDSKYREGLVEGKELYDCDIRPIAFINGKKYRAKFKISGNNVIIKIDNKKKEYALEKCSFAYKFKYFTMKGGKVMPSGYNECYLSVFVRK